MIEVYLDDAECKNFAEADRWASECCASYRGVEISDTSNFVLGGDELAVYKFESSADAAFFTLTWKSA
jgi:hypothetical protein